MKCPPLLFVCWCSSILAVTSCIQVDGYSCVSAYRDSITCVLNITGNPVEQPTYSLKFTDYRKAYSCPLLAANHTYSCVCKVTEGKDYFLAFNEYDIVVCQESDCHRIAKDFQPSQNIQLTPPHEPVVQSSLDTVNITWTSGYEDSFYLNNAIDFEVFLRTSQSEKSRTLTPNSHEKSLSVQRSQFERGATYCFEVRSLPGVTGYKGTWSKWSPSTCWKNEEAFSEQQDNILVILTKSLGPVCVAAGVLLFVFYSPAARMKIKTLSHTPSPASFFQPLFQQHEGNLKEWLSPQGRYVLTYKTEEILTTDAVIVVPKPIAKDPEEKQDTRSPSVTHLPFIQCQTSYVGLPGIHEPPPPLTMVCPGEMAYTQLPCSVLGVEFKEVEVAPFPPKDFFNLSSADSGCSCEDLTQSLECSLPSSPVDNSAPPAPPAPPLCNCTDYCILNKTAEGFAPVLVSKGGSINVPSDSLQEDKS